MRGPPIDPASLLLEAGTVHLLSGGEAPLPRATVAAYAAYAADKSSGAPGRQRLEAKAEQVRDRMAALAGTVRQHIGFVSSASAALTMAVAALDWREGDRIVTLADDYPSVVLAGLGLERHGVSVRLVAAGDDPVSALLEAVEARTRLVLASQVSFRHGRRLDIARLAHELQKLGIALGVDASHALGVLPVPVAECDFVVSCGHKFLLGSHGTGILFWNAARLGQPRTPAGWFSVAHYDVAQAGASFTAKPGALAFELGNPDFPALYALEAGLDLLDGAGSTAIAEHALALSGVLRERLAGLGWDVWTPRPEAARGTSIAIGTDHAAEIAMRLAAARIHVAAGEGRLRLSVHGFNTEADLETAIARLGAP